MRIFRWADAPLPWRLLLAHQTGDPTPRTHLAVVPKKRRAQEPPVAWTDYLRTVVEDAEGLSGLEEGDELVAGNEPDRPELSAAAVKLKARHKL